MKILLTTHSYPPFNNDGTNMIHDIALFLKSVGHEVKALHFELAKYSQKKFYVHEGIDVFADLKNQQQWEWPDCFITHLHATNITLIKANEVSNKKKKEIPIFHIIHSELPASYYSQLKSLKLHPSEGRNFAIYNSQFLADFHHFKFPGVIVNPPCSIKKYNVNTNPFESSYITLINLSEAKGGKLFYDIARAMPEYQFMGVMSTGNQIIQKLPNVKIVPNTPDIQSVYKETRLLLDFFLHESWGKVATEAMCNGIPVIAVDAPGLHENLDDAGSYIKNREDINEWVAAIKKFDKNDQCKMFYRRHSGECRKRSKELEELNLKQLTWLNKIITNDTKESLFWNYNGIIMPKDEHDAKKVAYYADMNRQRPVFRSTLIVTEPTIGLIGEAGPEIIIPLNKNGANI